MRAKKRFGQNFLHSQRELAAIVEAGRVEKEDFVLEVGPGYGSLTAHLLEKGARVIAIEKDRDLIPFLKEKFTQEIERGQLTLIESDVRDIDIKKVVGENPYKVVANIPYYITGFIIRFFLESQQQPTSMTLLVQKEVAQRIARDKKESLLSLSVKAYGEPHFVKKVSRGVFSPQPKVDSAILAIENISRKNFPDKKLEGKFFQILKTGFASGRKRLLANLSAISSKERLEKTFDELKLDKNVRAEDVPLKAWMHLARLIDLI